MFKISAEHFFSYFLVPIIAVLAAGGWIWNIIKLIHMNFNEFTGLLIVRALGVIIAPLGAVMGYL